MGSTRCIDSLSQDFRPQSAPRIITSPELGNSAKIVQTKTSSPWSSFHRSVFLSLTRLCNVIRDTPIIAAIFDHVKPRSLSPSICDLETLNLGLALDLALPLSMGSGWHRKLYCHYGPPRANLRTHYTSQLVWGVISANINFQILLCHSPMLLFSFRILLFPFEFCYSFFWFYYAIMNSFIQFPILLFAFELCYAVFQSCYSIVQSSHAVSNPIISFQILLFSFPILLCSVSNSIIRFRIMFFQIRDFVYLADGALGTSNKLISQYRKTWRTWTSTLCGIDYEPA